MKTYKIHLIRHGMTQGNLDGTYVGHKDIPVCEQGIQSLEQMKKDMTYPETPVLFCSPLLRCRQTAKILFPDKEPIIINDLIEYNFGEFEGKSADELKENDLFKEWLYGGPEVAPPFGESNGEFGVRISNAFEKIVEGLLKTGVPEATIVTHGGVIMGIMNRFALPELPMPEWLVPNGCGFTVRITPSLWTHAEKVEVAEEIPYIELTEEEEAEYGIDHSSYADFGDQTSGFGFVDMKDLEEE